MTEDHTIEDVKEYYGKVLSNTNDLQTNACTCSSAPPERIRKALSNVHDEIKNRYYGCGLTIPVDDLKGLKILDLGCGAGQDCYIVSQLVGEQGQVVGVDMTDEQITIAQEYVEHHAKVFGYSSPNTRFIKGYIEKLDELDLESEYFDIIMFVLYSYL